MTRDASAALAVIPFNYRGSQPDGLLVATELTERIADCLARTRQCRFRVRPLRGDLSVSAWSNDTRWLLKGSLSEHGGSVCVRAALVDAFAGRHLWGEHLRTSRRSMADVVESVVRDVSTELSAHVTNQSERTVPMQQPRELRSELDRSHRSIERRLPVSVRNRLD